MAIKKNINIFKQRGLDQNAIPLAQRQTLYDKIDEKTTFFPKGVLHEDLDNGFFSFVRNKLELIIDGEKVPALFLSQQRWNEFSQTWQFQDEFENIKIPFIIILKKYNTDISQTPRLYNIPVDRKYTYKKVPTWDGNRKGFDIYRIPYPIPIDMDYEVKLFCYKIRDLNEFNKNVLKAFPHRQAYAEVNGHYIPLHLEGVDDESNLTSIDEKKFYVQNYNMKLVGFLLDEKDFEVVPAINRTFSVLEIDEPGERKPLKRLNLKPSDLVVDASGIELERYYYGVSNADVDLLTTDLATVASIVESTFTLQTQNIFNQFKTFFVGGNQPDGKYIYFLTPETKIPTGFSTMFSTITFFTRPDNGLVFIDGQSYNIYRSPNPYNGDDNGQIKAQVNG